MHSKRCEFLNSHSFCTLIRYGDQLLVLEEIALKAIEEMLDEWKEKEDEPFDPCPDLKKLTGKIMSSLVS